MSEHIPPEEEDEDFDEEEDEDFDEEEEDEEELEDDDEEDEDDEDLEEAKEAPPPPPEAETTSGEAPISPQQIPFHLTIEAGRVRMSMQQLMDLQPGNVLELGVKPETGVQLVINDKVVGRGELIVVGEALGVRVLEKG